MYLLASYTMYYDENRKLYWSVISIFIINPMVINTYLAID